MLTRFNPIYKFVCDRCGKEEIIKDEDSIIPPTVAFVLEACPIVLPKRIKGQVCPACENDFLELANNFFDEVNKERSKNDNT